MMNLGKIPLTALTIDELYNVGRATYEIPVYQRNYAWGKDEISALVQDVYDSMCKTGSKHYYIGTLVTFDRGETRFEVIDGQQRLTTLYLVLKALGINVVNRLTYSARSAADTALKSLPDCHTENADFGIIQGFKWAKRAIEEIVPESRLQSFGQYFLKSVQIIHYIVPKDVDLNHYFEVMNSRGEQLEKYEIVKARMLEQLTDDVDKDRFSAIWNACMEMNVYIQRILYEESERIFGRELSTFPLSNFSELPRLGANGGNTESINTILADDFGNDSAVANDGDNRMLDTFQPIIDFSNFLLIVLKITLALEGRLRNEVNLDDKELLNEFGNVELDSDFVKKFGFNLLKAKFFLDNRIVHHANMNDDIGNNPWKLQQWHGNDRKSGYLKDIARYNAGDDIQDKLTQLLSMFETSFTPRQRKNYLFYCLMYLFCEEEWDARNYCQFLEKLADKYFYEVYLDARQLNEAKSPKPGSFDAVVFPQGRLDVDATKTCVDFREVFKSIYGDGEKNPSCGIPLFVFNYLDYRLWAKYQFELRGEESKGDSPQRRAFFEMLGCNDMDLNNFSKFYFSRTRRSLEHYFPQANADGTENRPNATQINCLGNYAMIGSDINSSGSNWEPHTKVHHYLDDHSGKVRHVSVASLKFLIMLQTCRDRGKWLNEEIQFHQDKMLTILNDRKKL